MKFICIAFLLTWSCITYGQYSPSTDGSPVNRPLGASGFSTDARSKFHDRTNFLWRDYRDTGEVRTYLTTTLFRTGNFPVFVHNGGTLQSTGLYTGGTTEAWWYKDGTANSNLVLMASGGGGSGTVASVTSGNLLNLATVSVTNSTTTPVFSFSLIQPTAHTFFGNNTSSTTAPSYVTLDTTDIPNFAAKVRSLFSGSDPTYPRMSTSADSTSIVLTRGDGTKDTVRFGASGSLGGGGGGGGTVTSIGMTVPSGLSVSPSSISSSGTFAVTTALNGILRGTGSGFTAGTIDTTDISAFATKVRSLFTISGGTYNPATGLFTVTPGGGGSGTVTTLSVAIANGISGTVTNPTTTPAITLALGAITPSSVTASGTVTGSNLSGTNTGNVSIGTANGLSLAAQALSLSTASGSTTGALTSTDWNTFNNKGAGTVTSFSAGDLAPIFTTTEATATTTPALSFTLSNAAAKTVLGNAGASTAAPSYVSLDTTFISAFATKVRSLFSVTGTGLAYNNATGLFTISAGAGSGTVTSFGVAAVPTGFSASVSNSTTTPTLTLSSSFATNQLLMGTSGGITTVGTGTNGYFLKYVAGVPTWVNDAAALTVDSTLTNTGNVLGVDPTKLQKLYNSVNNTSSAYTVAAGVYTVFSNYTGGTATVTLPAANINKDTRVTIKNRSANNVTVTPVATGEVNTLTQYGAITYQSDGTVWMAVSNN